MYRPSQTCYLIYESAVTRPEAEGKCHQALGMLASIHTQAENDFLGNHLGESMHCVTVTDNMFQCFLFVWNERSYRTGIETVWGVILCRTVPDSPVVSARGQCIPKLKQHTHIVHLYGFSISFMIGAYITQQRSWSWSWYSNPPTLTFAKLSNRSWAAATCYVLQCISDRYSDLAVAPLSLASSGILAL